MLRFKLIIAFDGKSYQGWQSQRSGLGVQDEIHLALARIFPEKPEIQGSSRTDAGVHAWGLAAHFEVTDNGRIMPVRHLPLALNALLPADIRIRSAVRVAADFNARFDAVGKEYRYHVWNHSVMNPLLIGRSWHVANSLDSDAMQTAALCFIGRHDFRSFTSKREGLLGDSMRTVARCEIRRSGPKLTFVIEAEGFLYKMCRGIVGTLVEIGKGKYPASSVETMLKERSRTVAGMNAPAHGLILQRVFYPR